MSAACEPLVCFSTRRRDGAVFLVPSLRHVAVIHPLLIIRSPMYMGILYPVVVALLTTKYEDHLFNLDMALLKLNI